MKSESRAFIKNRRNSWRASLAHWTKRWRSGLIRFLERALSGSNISDRLGGDLTQIQHLDEVKKQISEIKVVSPPIFTQETEINGILTYQASLQRKVGVLKDCAVHTHSGLIRLDSGFIIDAVLPHWQQLIYQGGLVHEYKALSRTRKYLRGTFVVIPGAKYFYHFLIEDLPNISWALEHYPECKVILSSESPDWQREILSELKIDFEITSTKALIIEKLVFVTSPRALTSPDISRIKNLRKKSTPSTGNLNLYITRGDKDRGNLQIEEGLIKFFSDKGYKIVNPDEITFSQQVKYFEEASKVVSFHGGALANLVWCRPGTLVLEIFNHAFRTYDYKKLCAEAELVYSSINLVNINLQAPSNGDLLTQIPENF